MVKERRKNPDYVSCARGEESRRFVETMSALAYADFIEDPYIEEAVRRFELKQLKEYALGRFMRTLRLEERALARGKPVAASRHSLAKDRWMAMALAFAYMIDEVGAGK